MAHKDPEKQRAYAREWARRNRTKTREYWKRKYAKNREAILARGKAWRQSHKEWERKRWYRRTPELDAKRKLRAELHVAPHVCPATIEEAELAALRRESPRLRRQYYRHSKYLSFEEFKRILPQLKSNGPCDCCGRKGVKMNIDHDHVANKLRGVLCGHCNHGIGFLGDNLAQVQKAVGYLTRVVTVMLVLLLVGSRAFAQTATPTNTPTATPTVTPTATFTATATAFPTFTPPAGASPTLAPQNTPSVQGAPRECQATKFCAFHYVAQYAQFAACSSSRTTSTITIPGIQPRDFVTCYSPNDASGIIVDSRTILGNNQVKIYAVCAGSSVANVTLDCLWWDRTDSRGRQFDLE